LFRSTYRMQSIVLHSSAIICSAHQFSDFVLGWYKIKKQNGCLFAPTAWSSLCLQRLELKGREIKSHQCRIF
jgi:hypothetical protein